MRRIPLLALLLTLVAIPAIAHESGSGSGSSTGGDCCRPRGKGFWHRQCLGLGELTPGKGQGQGPGLHPAFTEEELRAIFRRADRRIGGRCEGACDALDESRYGTARGRALAQYATLVLNAEAGWLQGCDPRGDRVRRVERLLDQERWQEAGDDCEGANEGRTIRRCADDDDHHGDHDDHDGDDDHGGRPHQHGPGCGHDGHDDHDDGKPHGKGKGKGKGK
jgi:hypothetical protein